MLSRIRHFLTGFTSTEKLKTVQPQVLLHPAKEGDILRQRYPLIRRLGERFGRRSTIWLSKDSKTENDVVIKITGSDSTDAGRYSQLEALFLEKVRHKSATIEQSHVIHMLEHFPISSIHGTHGSLVLERLGPSVAQVMNWAHPNKLPVRVCRQIIKQVLVGLDFLHRECGIVHTDLKLDNLLLRLAETQGTPDPGNVEHSTEIDFSRVSLGSAAVVITDLGVASNIEEPFNGVIQPYALRAPEVYLGIPYGPPADIWSLGCLAFELVTYCWLFNPTETSKWSRDDDILEQMVSLNGLELFPVDVLARGKYSDRFFDKTGKLHGYNVGACSIRGLLDSRCSLQPEDEPDAFADLLSRMLRLRPEDRESASELLIHPWLRAT
ncbi:kinase-like domain-containing protein [Desarmillaria tabescens]|uniref:non-specific serine/threonine protein kinase n=1 Tax=Armillaria tabescens TaxID=1929756 RepID=A0AA39NHV8_ARMTA|nr:kinase-like domain-containing protein [Desarmillaria tabescens]KAK0465940.1 kinase-like domain-containing protein [Desarmillaria tabescens]